MSANQVYLVTGANRGIGECVPISQLLFTNFEPAASNFRSRYTGFALVKELASKHSDIVTVAGVRDPAAATALKTLADQYPERIHITRYVSADVENNKALAKEIETKYGHVDVVIANAGICSMLPLKRLLI